MAVRDLTLQVPAGELFAFLGPNGAGKTTTIKMLCGLLFPTTGTVRVGAIVRQGAEGCLVALRGGAITHLPARRVVAVDSNGAGDTHVGASLAGLLRGLDPVEAARAANDAAAAFVSRPHG